MTNTEISRLLRNVAAAYSIKDEKKFRFQIIAYQKAADAIDHSATELRDLYHDKKLDDVPGIGTSIKSYLEELFRQGEVRHFKEILNGVPNAVFPLLDIPSFGPKKAYKLVTSFKFSNPESVIADLENKAKSGKIATLEGFGEKSERDIIQALEEYGLGKTKTARMVLPYANELAERMVGYLKKSKSVLQASPLGSLRRRLPTIGDIDIAVATNDPDDVLTHFTSYPRTERVIERGDKTSSILISSGRQIDLMVAPPEGFGALLQHFTGSKSHNIRLREYALSKGLSLSEVGIRKKGEGNDKAKLFASEQEFYGALGLSWIPPEIREDTGEVELAKKNALPKLVELDDIKGDFHIHSSYPIEPSHDMGQNSMEEMIEHAIKFKYNYLGFSEHNPSVSKHTNLQVSDILEKRYKYIEQLRLKYKNKIRIFSLLETDILTNGSLAIDNKGLAFLDATIVSIHSGFDMDRETMTKRVLKGLSHPKAKILAHPTGRLLNQRTGYDLDWDKVFAFCLENNKALEINAWPLRLDLPDSLVRRAVEKGVMLVIDTDSHASTHMSLMEFGLSVARRGWATANDILNTKSYNEVERWFKS
jgi:DNA polymerase (family 10)